MDRSEKKKHPHVTGGCWIQMKVYKQDMCRNNERKQRKYSFRVLDDYHTGVTLLIAT